MDKKKQAQKEYEELKRWVSEEEEKVVEKLKSEGRYIGGLDANRTDFAYIYKERNKRLKEIKEKFTLD